jgi:transposase
MEERLRIRIEGVSKRQVLRETGMHWTTLEKILAVSSPPGYQRRMPCRKPRIGAYLGRIEEILEQDKEMPKKPRHTAKRIWERLREEGFEGGYTVVKDVVRELRMRRQEVFMPLIHRPGEAQVDFGVALAKMNGTLRKVSFFAMTLPHSDAFFVMAFDRECTETFCEGHVRAFAHFQGVPYRITCDNTKICIAQITGKRRRGLTKGFLQWVSHYLFDPHFCLVRRAHLESLVRFDTNDCSVPVRYAHHPVLIKGYADRTDLCYGRKVIAVHPRCWEKEKQLLDPMHYLSLVERKPGSLDYARPLEDWGLPEVFDVLRRRLEEEHRETDSGEGAREYIRVLRLLERYTLGELTKAIEQALKMRCHSRDAIAQFLVPAESWEATTFKLDGHPHLRHVKVTPNDPKLCACLQAVAGGVQ